MLSAGSSKGVEHYFVERPKCELRFYEIETEFFGVRFKFKTSSGVFSPRKIDRGTRLLVEKCEVGHGDKILDLGCGYGVVGIVLAKVYGCDATLCDINERALRLARYNARMNGVKVKVIKSYVYSNIKEKFDHILTYPPYHAGLRVCFEFIDGAPDHLRKGGSLQLIALKGKGHKRMRKRMEDVFGNVEKIGKKGLYLLYRSFL